MKSIKELELELQLVNLKLAKMTSTVKQLGTKLRDANKSLGWAEQDSGYYKHMYNKLSGDLSKLVLSRDECHERANEINNRKF